MKKVWWVVPLLIVIVLVVAIYFSFVFTPKCDNLACWEKKLAECGRAKYFNEPVDVRWEYKIKGSAGDKCEVEVEAVEIIRGLTKTQRLEEKSMTCYFPKGAVVVPENNVNLCTGPLKEEMQDLIIEKLHEYIVQNVGEIGDNLDEIEGVTTSPDISGNESAELNVSQNSS